MKFTKRLKYYLIGFGLGTIMVILIFLPRGCEWMPNNRVLHSINSSQLVISNKNRCLIDCNNISYEKIFHLAKKGNVNFNESDTKNQIRHYVIEHNKLKLTFLLNQTDSISEIININQTHKCNCDTADNELQPIYMPNNMALNELLSKEIKRNKIFNCQFDCLDLNNSIIDDLFIESEILFDHSFPNKKPNPLFLLKLYHNKRSLFFLIEEGATKTRLKQVLEISNDKATNDSILDLITNGEIFDTCLCVD